MALHARSPAAPKRRAAPPAKAGRRHSPTAASQHDGAEAAERPEGDADPAVDAAVQRQQASRVESSRAALQYLAAQRQVGDEGAAALRQALAELSPDDARALRKVLKPRAGGSGHGAHAGGEADADLELVARRAPGAHPYRHRMSTAGYEAQKYRLQVELLKLAKWVKDTGARVVVLFEGRDAAGKGGTIKRFMEHLNPRGARVVALEKPDEVEQGQWYFQRYVQHLPTRGEIVLFDRSWYNRAGVERVMGFCSDTQVQEFLRAAPRFERHLVDSGIVLIKFWFSVSRAEQLRRFERRKTDPLKRWKISRVDLASIDRWDDYTAAKEAMFAATHTAHAPWTVIDADCKKRARLNAMRVVLHRLPYDHKDLHNLGEVDPLLVRSADAVLRARKRGTT